MQYLWYWARYTYDKGHEHFGPYPNPEAAHDAIREEKRKQPPLLGLCSYSCAYAIPQLED